MKKSFYQHLMNHTWNAISTFWDTAKKGQKTGWKKPGPAQWDLSEVFNLREAMEYLPEAKIPAVSAALEEISTELTTLLIITMREGQPRRVKNRAAMALARSIYSAKIKPALKGAKS